MTDLFFAASVFHKNFDCDSEGDCYSIPGCMPNEELPLLIYLSCTGGNIGDIDSLRMISDSLHWAVATPASSKNHRSPLLNEEDILHLVNKMKDSFPIDQSKIILMGFSGQGAQAWGTAMRNPKIFSGVISSCAHTGSITTFNPETSQNQAFYIITREDDWNFDHNALFHDILSSYDIDDTLIITSGEHGIGSMTETLQGCRWFDRRWRKK